MAIEPGGPLREGDVAKTQRQLYNLGVFNRVQIAPQNPDGTDPDKAVVVEVQEGQRYTIGYGFGFEVQRIAGGSTNPGGTTIGASPRGIFEIARNNMFGRAQTLSFKARVSTLEYRVALGYTADNFLADQHLSLQLTGFADKTQDINTFTSTRFEGGLQLVQKLSPSSSLLYRYFYRRVEASNLVSTINQEQIPLFSQPTLVSGFGVTYARDRRDDPGNATRGTFNTVDVSDAIESIGSSASFFRAYFQNSSFHSFGRAFVFARSVRFGVEVPYGNTVEGNMPFEPAQCTAPPPAVTPPVIPLPERFFAGGGTSLRGFGLNQAGPRDPCTGFPIGGLALLIFNQEMRFPMKLPIVGNRLGGTLFYDGGNVYSDVNHISFAWKAPVDYGSQLFFAHGRIRSALPHADRTRARGLRLSAESGLLSGNRRPARWDSRRLADSPSSAFRIFLQHRTDLLMRRALLILVCVGWLARARWRRGCAGAWAAIVRAGAQAERKAWTASPRALRTTYLTESEVRELGAFQQLVDGSPKPRTDRIRELADQWIVRGEIEAAKYPPPSAADVDRAYAQLAAQFSSPEEFTEALRGGRAHRRGRPANAGAAALSFSFPRLPVPARRAN